MDRGWSRRSWSGIACRRRSFNHRVKGPKGSHVVEERRIRDAEAPRIRDVHRVVRRETGDGGSHQDAMVCTRVDERAVQARGSGNDATVRGRFRLGRAEVEAFDGHVSARDRRGDKRKGGRREVPRYVQIRRVVRPPAGHEVGVLVHHNLDAERADHLPRHLDVWLRASRGKDADFRRIRRERAGDEKTRKKLGADGPGQGDAATAQDSLDLDGRTTIARNGRSAGTEAREGLEERTHRTFLEARIARERRRTIEKRGHAREETQRRPGVPCVDRHPGWVQGIRNDPEPVRGWFNHRAERGHACNRSRGILRKERPTNATRAVRQGGEDDRTVSVALRRRSTNRSGDSRRADSVPQATTSRDSIVFRRTTRTSEDPSSIALRTASTWVACANARMDGPVPVIPAAFAPAARARIAGVSSTPSKGA